MPISARQGQFPEWANTWRPPGRRCEHLAKTVRASNSRRVLRQLTWLIPLTGLTALLGACDKGSQPATPPASKTVKTAAPKKAPPSRWAQAFEHKVRWSEDHKAVVVDMKVQPGFHVYTKGESTGRPVSLKFDEASEFQLKGELIYPKGIEKNLAIGKSVIVEGSAQLAAPVEAKSEGATEAKGKFGYQVCSHEACDRPRKVDFNLKRPN